MLVLLQQRRLLFAGEVDALPVPQQVQQHLVAHGREPLASVGKGLL